MRRLVAALAAKADGMRKHLQFLAHRAGSPILAQSQVERLAEVQQLATPARRAELERQIADLDKRRQAVDAVREETLHVLHRELVQLPPKVLLGVLDAVGARVPTLVGSAGVERPRAMLADAIIEAAREDSSAFLAAVRQLVDQGETPRGGPIGDALERLAASFANSTETIRKMDSLYAQVESQVGLTPQELMERLGNNEDLRAVLTNEARKTALAAGRPELADQFASHVEIAEYDGIKREIAEKLSRLSREEQERCLAEGDLSGLVADSLPGVPGAPTSTLANEPRLTLTEWGAFIVRALAAAGDNHDLVRVVDDYLRKRSVEAFGIAHRASACQEIEDSTRWVTALSAIWAQCGFPLVQPTHKLAASLMATSMPRECVPEVAVPWRCFAVAVPNGLLPPIFNTITRTSSEVKFIGLFDPQEERDDSKFYGKLVLWGAMADHTLLFTDTIDSLADLTRSATSAASNDVTMELLSRLLLGALIELDSPKNQQTIAKGPRPQKAPRMGKAPSCWAFDLRRDVRVDLRPWVREYVVGGGKTASVQVLVRGHHKRQAHGPGHKERKWVHIEPYWRGPEDAPIAVRGHRVVAE